MLVWLQAWLHTVVYEYIDNERGQDALVVILIVLLILLLISSRRLLVQ